MRWRDDSETHQIGEMCMDCWRKVVYLDNKESCGWTIPSAFEEQVAVGTERKGNIGWVAEIAVVLLMPIHDNLLVKQAMVVLAIEDITNTTRNMPIVITVK